MSSVQCSFLPAARRGYVAGYLPSLGEPCLSNQSSIRSPSEQTVVALVRTLSRAGTPQIVQAPSPQSPWARRTPPHLHSTWPITRGSCCAGYHKPVTVLLIRGDQDRLRVTYEQATRVESEVCREATDSRIDYGDWQPLQISTNPDPLALPRSALGEEISGGDTRPSIGQRPELVSRWKIRQPRVMVWVRNEICLSPLCGLLVLCPLCVAVHPYVPAHSAHHVVSRFHPSHLPSGVKTLPQPRRQGRTVPIPFPPSPRNRLWQD